MTSTSWASTLTSSSAQSPTSNTLENPGLHKRRQPTTHIVPPRLSSLPQFREWCVICSGLSGLVGNLSSLCCVGNGIEVEPMGGEYGLGDASCENICRG